MRVVRTRRGARLVAEDDDVVLSEILAVPGPTHSLFDALAACIAALAPGPRIALLGFAGGGVVAPLRAMGCPHPIRAVDLSREGEAIFRELSSTWCGDVTLDVEDAERWLARRRARYDLIVEDLSVSSPVGTVKPYATFDTIPERIARRLRTGGLAVFNMLPLPGTRWEALIARVGRPWARVVTVELDEYENRFVLAGHDLPPAAALSRRVRAALRGIDSSQTHQLKFRTIRA